MGFQTRDAPAGATITTNGLFKWTPACAQGSSTNEVIILATDFGSPPMSSSNKFVVIVPECIEASVGNTVLLRGSTSSVPVRLLSRTALTNMAFTVGFPPERLTNFTLTVNSPQVITQELTVLQPGQLRVSFTLPATSVLRGPTNVGELGFTAVADQHSAFVSLAISNVEGRKPEGGFAAAAFGQSGRVVVIGPEPLLEAWRSDPTNVMLTLYGNPGSNYALQTMTNGWLGSEWLHGLSLNATNLETWIEWTNRGEPMRFFRARTQ